MYHHEANHVPPWDYPCATVGRGPLPAGQSATFSILNNAATSASYTLSVQSGSFSVSPSGGTIASGATQSALVTSVANSTGSLSIVSTVAGNPGNAGIPGASGFL